MGDADLISRLPTDLLVSILSRLTVKEAVATSVISRHWEELWTFYHGNFNFKVPYKLHRVECSKHAGVVYKVLRTFDQVESGAVFDSFTIRFHLCPTSLASVDKCVQFALEKRRVKGLQFQSYGSCDGRYNHGVSYDFPSLNYFYTQPRNIQTLTYIHFDDVNVSSEVIEHFLSNCPDLQSLKLCSLKTPLLHLRVSGETLALKHLFISSCPDLSTIEISAPNLVSFVYSETTNANFYVRNIPKLVELSIGLLNTSKKPKPSMGHSALYLLSCFSHIQKLVFLCNKEPGDFIKVNELTSVKHLTLRSIGACIRIPAWTPLLKAFPVLQKLTLDMQGRFLDGTDGVIRYHDKFPNQCLKEFEFLGFGISNDSKLVMYFLKSIVRLEKIILGCGGRIPTWVDTYIGCVEAANLAAELKQMILEEVSLKFIGCSGEGICRPPNPKYTVSTK